MGNEHLLSPISGEYRDPGLEAAYRQDRLRGTVRDVRILLLVVIVINIPFLLRDAALMGEPTFPAILGGRLAIIGACAATFAALAAIRGHVGLHRLLLAWEVVYGVCAAVVIGASQSQSGLVTAFLIVAVHHLAVPLRFWWSAAMGVLGGALLLVALAWERGPSLDLGLTMAAVITFCLVVVHCGNRLHRLAAAALTAQREAVDELEQMFAATPVPLAMTTADGVLVKANDATFRYFGYAPEELLGRSIVHLHADAVQRREFVDRLRAEGHVEGVELDLVRADGSLRTMLAAASVVRHDGRTCVITGLTDISERKQLEAELRRVAASDPLTGLPNRRAFFDALESETARSRRYGQPLAVVMLDIDHFKIVNDSHGHHVGDRVLRAFAQHCRSALREQDITGRLGGEEFGVILPQTSAEEAIPVAERLRASTEALVVHAAGQAVGISISIGIGPFRFDDTDGFSALRRADAALYVAKRDGRNRVRLHADAPVGC